MGFKNWLKFRKEPVENGKKIKPKLAPRSIFNSVPVKNRVDCNKAFELILSNQKTSGEFASFFVSLKRPDLERLAFLLHHPNSIEGWYRNYNKIQQQIKKIVKTAIEKPVPNYLQAVAKWENKIRNVHLTMKDCVKKVRDRCPTVGRSPVEAFNALMSACVEFGEKAETGLEKEIFEDLKKHYESQLKNFS